MFYGNDFSKAERILKEHLQQRKKTLQKKSRYVVVKGCRDCYHTRHCM